MDNVDNENHLIHFLIVYGIGAFLLSDIINGENSSVVNTLCPQIILGENIQASTREHILVPLAADDCNKI